MLLELWDELPDKKRNEPGIVEHLCVAAGMPPSEYWGKLAEISYRYNFTVAQTTAATAAVQVLRASAEFAMEKGNFKDRELILKAAKILEQGALVNVTQTNQTLSVSSNLPSLGQLTGKISEMARGELPAAKAPLAFIEGEVLEPEPLSLPQADGDGRPLNVQLEADSSASSTD